MTQYIKASAIARQLHVTPETVNRWCRTGQLRATKAGRSWLIQPSDLEAFLKQSKGEQESNQPTDLAMAS
jgi:excisionase family DNA binding protein